MPPAALGAKLKSGAWMLFHSKKEQSVRHQYRAGRVEDRAQFAQIYEGVCRQNEIVCLAKVSEVLNIAHVHRAIDSPVARLRDHGWTQIHAIESRCKIAKLNARQSGATTEVENAYAMVLHSRHDQRGEFAQNTRRSITQLVKHARVVIAGELIDEVTDIARIGTRRLAHALGLCSSFRKLRR